MKHRELKIRIPQPEIHLDKSKLNRWLPSPGNVIFTLLMIGLLLWAQSAGAIPLPAARSAPDASSTSTISYQGRLADTSGTPVTALVNMEFRIYSAASGGGPLWEEFWTGANAVSVSDGLFNVMLGSLVPIPQNVVSGNNSLWLGVTAGTDNEMVPRVQLGSVPFATQALTVPDGSVTTAKIANAAVTAAKLDSTPWTDLSLQPGWISPPDTNFQKAQFRRIGDIVYLRGTIKIISGCIGDRNLVATLPAGLWPNKYLSFVAEPFDDHRTKHRIDIRPNGEVYEYTSASVNGSCTRFIGLDGMLFSIS